VPVRRRLHSLRRLLPPGPRRRLSGWLRSRGFRPDAHYTIRIEYPTSASNSPRWNPHAELERIIAGGAQTYRGSLEAIAGYRDSLARLAGHAAGPLEPSFANEWLPPLDAAAIYGFIRHRSPALYLEVGSGESTKFAARARRDGDLRTRIVSIDPQPRSEVDQLCDRALRVPLEAADLSAFDELSEGDVVFFDGSHRAFMNSDATVFFLEVLPRLAPGVLMGVHDVFLPYDYPAEYADRYYSEQYLLAAHLLAGNPLLEPVLPAFYASRDPELRSLAPVEPRGHGFWMQTRAA
jgi:hypothetical protein